MVRKPRSTHVAAMQRGGAANLDAELATLAPGATTDLLRDEAGNGLQSVVPAAAKRL